MILKVDNEFFEKFKEPDIADICYYAAEYGHFIDTIPPNRMKLQQNVNLHCSTSQKDIFKYAKKRFSHLTSEHRQYLTTINGSSYDIDTLKRILKSPARLLLENMMYEEPVYKCMISSYKHDRTFGNMFAMLEMAIKKNWIEFAHGGGFGSFEKYLITMDKGEYKSIAKLKFCTIMDRDQDSAILPTNRDSLFRYLSDGKDHESLEDSDIYTLTFQGCVWHLWYKRAIENYFPDKCYIACGYNPAVIWPPIPADRNYKKIITEGIGKFQKEDLSCLPLSMSRKDYEIGLQHFNIEGKDISELQLFLLKLVKII